MENELNEEKQIEEMINSLVERAKIASQEYLKLDQDTVDNIIKAMAMAGLENHMKLAKMAVEETGRGIYEDKITKNMFATEYIYHSIKYEKTSYLNFIEIKVYILKNMLYNIMVKNERKGRFKLWKIKIKNQK